MKISVVIPAYNEEKYIGRTLDSIKKLELSGNELELIVIDGDSKDKTPEIAKEHGAIVYHEPHKSIGFARQHGLKHATGEIVAYTDSDTIVPNDWLLKHLSVLKRKGVFLSLGVFRVYDGSFPYYHHINYMQIPIQRILNKFFNITLAVGQNMAVWREKALEIGGFNEDLKLMEDFDFA